MPEYLTRCYRIGLLFVKVEVDTPEDLQREIQDPRMLRGFTDDLQRQLQASPAGFEPHILRT